MKKKSRVALLVVIAVIAVLAAILAVQVTKLMAIQPTSVQEITAEASTSTPTMTAAPTKDPNMTVGIAHGIALRFPAECADVLVHEQEVHGGQTTEVFSMRTEADNIPLFRIDFGAEEAGDWFGVLNTDSGVVPVVHTLFVLTDDEINAMDENGKEQYYVLMECFNAALNAIAADSRFSEEKPLDMGVMQEAKMAYWTVMLPGGMSWTETSEDDNYQATFYGTIQGERVALYTVCIGDVEAESVLGMYKVAGVPKKVSVECFELNRHGTWEDEDYSAAYLMMDTINDVIAQIMSSELYSETMLEEIPAEAANG